MSTIFKFIGYVLLTIGGIFTIFQIYLDRKSAATDTIGTAWQLSDPMQNNEGAIRWALTELAPCHDLARMRYGPRSLLEKKPRFHEREVDDLISKKYLEHWDLCRNDSFSFSGAQMKRSWLHTFSFCPNSLENGEFWDMLQFKFTPRVTIRRSSFVCVSFSKSNMAFLKSEKSNFRGASFVGAKLQNSQWDKTDLRNTSFVNAVLTKATFEDVQMEGADFFGAKLQDTKFDQVSLLGTENFKNANVSSADLSGLNHLKSKQIAEACIDDRKSAPKLPPHLAGQEKRFRICGIQ